MVEPGGERLRIEVGGAGGVPGRVEWHLEGGEVEVEQAGDAVGGAVGVRGGDQADVELPLPLAQLDALPGGVGGEGGDAQLGGKSGQVVLGGADPLSAAVDGEPGRRHIGE